MDWRRPYLSLTSRLPDYYFCEREEDEREEMGMTGSFTKIAKHPSWKHYVEESSLSGSPVSGESLASHLIQRTKADRLFPVENETR